MTTPAVSISPPAPAPATEAGPPAQSSVLVVDDTEANRDTLGRRLQRHGYIVAAASDGPEALKMIEQRRFDLVLLDIMMPGMSGLDVLQRIRQTRSTTELPVIMATARDQSDDIVKAFSMGASDYVTKPLDFPVVLARVQTHLTLKHSVEKVLNLERCLSEHNTALEAANGKLTQAAVRTQRDLQAAARIQESFLPKSHLKAGRLQFDWTFRPCEALAGDSLNICPLDADHLGVYVLDVTGHGVAAALLAVAATRVLSPASDPDSLLVHVNPDTGNREPLPPAQVADRLNRKFAWGSDTEQFVTLFYAVVNIKSGDFRYVSAGHPGAIHLKHSSPAVTLDGSGMPIGIGESYLDQTAHLDPGDRLYLYSDGVTEAMSPQRDLFGKQRLVEVLDRGRTLKLKESIALLMTEINDWCGSTPPSDDISVVGIECDA
jgi:phosphoserine phosphatase RsbU/P